MSAKLGAGGRRTGGGWPAAATWHLAQTSSASWRPASIMAASSAAALPTPTRTSARANPSEAGGMQCFIGTKTEAASVPPTGPLTKALQVAIEGAALSDGKRGKSGHFLSFSKTQRYHSYFQKARHSADSGPMTITSLQSHPSRVLRDATYPRAPGRRTRPPMSFFLALPHNALKTLDPGAAFSHFFACFPHARLRKNAKICDFLRRALDPDRSSVLAYFTILTRLM